MERIYFDKQIFSHLFKGNMDNYQLLLNQIIENKSNFLFCYSHAHLLDLKNDKTEIKFDELRFIETIVNDNYLSYNPLEKRTSCYLAKPLDAFEDENVENEIFSLSNLLEEIDFSSIDSELSEQLKNGINILKNQKMDFGTINLNSSNSEQKEFNEKFFPLGLEPMTFIEWSDFLMKSIEKLENDKKAYKGMRNLLNKSIDNEAYKLINTEIDYPQLNKSFLDLIKNNLNPNNDKTISDYDFYVNAYFTLDCLGLSKDSNAQFKNITNDGIHSYYGAFCDIVVSEDQGFLKKTKALYNLLGIQSKIYHINDFIENFPTIILERKNNFPTFIDNLISDLKQRKIIEKKSRINDVNKLQIKPENIYLSYFNTIEIDENNDLTMLRETRNYSDFNFFREYQGITNNAITVFGLDSDSKGEFLWDIETLEIKNKTWLGRFWDFPQSQIELKINDELNKICLQIKIKK